MVCDRDRPVAMLSPVADESDLEWERHKAGMQALAKRTGEIKELPSVAQEELEPGDRLIMKTPGGGGWGTPFVT